MNNIKTKTYRGARLYMLKVCNESLLINLVKYESSEKISFTILSRLFMMINYCLIRTNSVVITSYYKSLNIYCYEKVIFNVMPLHNGCMC